MEYPYQRIIAEFQDRQQNVGLAVAVLSEGCFVFADVFGWADREAEVRATLETPFGIASVTKAFTGAALLKLYEEGRIDLDAEIQRYIPEFPLHPAASVTLRQLAAHLAGIRHWGPERNADLNARHFRSGCGDPALYPRVSTPPGCFRHTAATGSAPRRYSTLGAGTQRGPQCTSLRRPLRHPSPVPRQCVRGRSGNPVPLLQLRLQPAGHGYPARSGHPISTVCRSGDFASSAVAKDRLRQAWACRSRAASPLLLVRPDGLPSPGYRPGACAGLGLQP